MAKEQNKGSVHYIAVHRAYLRIKRSGKLLLPTSSVKREANEMYLREKSESEEKENH